VFVLVRHALARHAGLDPASTFFFSEAGEEEGGPRIKSGVTILGAP
jgi:hypothetical protein